MTKPQSPAMAETLTAEQKYANWKRERDASFDRLDAIKSRSGEGDEFFREMQRSLERWDGLKKEGQIP